MSSWILCFKLSLISNSGNIVKSFLTFREFNWLGQWVTLTEIPNSNLGDVSLMDKVGNVRDFPNFNPSINLISQPPLPFNLFSHPFIHSFIHLISFHPNIIKKLSPVIFITGGIHSDFSRAQLARAVGSYESGPNLNFGADSVVSLMDEVCSVRNFPNIIPSIHYMSQSPLSFNLFSHSFIHSFNFILISF